MNIGLPLRSGLETDQFAGGTRSGRSKGVQSQHQLINKAVDQQSSTKVDHSNLPQVTSPCWQKAPLEKVSCAAGGPHLAALFDQPVTYVWPHKINQELVLYDGGLNAGWALEKQGNCCVSGTRICLRAIVGTANHQATGKVCALVQVAMDLQQLNLSYLDLAWASIRESGAEAVG